MSGGLRWVRHLAVFAWLLIFAAVALLWNTWAFLRTPYGASRLAGQVERRVSALLAGEIKIGGLGTVGVVGVRIKEPMVLDPYGNPVIAARRVDVVFDPWDLFWGNVAAEVRVEGGRVEVAYIEAEDDVGIGLAFAPPPGTPPTRHQVPGPRTPLPPEPPLPIELKSLVVENTAFRLSDTPGGEADVLVREIGIGSSGTWGERGAAATLVLAAQTLLPVAAPLSLDVEAAFAGDWLDALKVHARLGDTVVRARGRGEMRVLTGRVVTEISVGAAEAREYGIPLQSDLAVGADIWLSLGRSSVALRASPGRGGALAVDGWFDRPTGETYVQLVLAEIDPARWMVEAPQGSITGTARLQGSAGTRPDLNLDLSLRRGSLLGQGVGPLEVRGRLLGSDLQLDRLELGLPGVSITARGAAGPTSTALDATLDLADAARLSRFATSLGVGPLPDLSGSGTLEIHLERQQDDVSLAGTLSSSQLSVDGVRMEDIQAEIGADWRQGQLPHGSLQATVGALEAGRLQGERFRVDANRSAAGAFSVDAEGQTRVVNRGSFSPTRLSAAGTAAENRIDLDRFSFRYGEGELHTARAATLRLGGGAVEIEGLRLELGDTGGYLVVDGSLSKQRISLDLEGSGLRLEVLPQAFFPEDLAGTVNLAASIHGKPTAPRGIASFEAKELRLGAFRDSTARGNVELEGGRARGDVVAALGGVGGVDFRFDGPIDPLGAPGSTPIDLDLRLGPIRLAGLGQALELEFPQGTVALSLIANGAIGKPNVRLEAQISDLHLQDEPDLPGTWTQITGSLREGFALVEIQTWADTARVLEIQATAPLDPRRLRRNARKEIGRVLASSQSHAMGRIRGLNLALISGWLNEPELEGALRSDFDIRGPILDPRGIIDIDLQGGPLGPLRSVVFTSRTEFLQTKSVLEARLLVENEAPAEIRAEVGTSPGALLQGTASSSTPISLSVEVPELDLSRLGARPTEAATRTLVRGASGRGPALAGTLRASGSFAGTFASVRGALQVRAMDLVFRGVPVGGFDLLVSQQPELMVALDFIDPEAGTLLARASFAGAITPLVLANQGAEALFELPMDLEVQGWALSLSPLSVVSTFARASGRAFIDVESRGTLASPRPLGEVHVTDGELELVGGPRYVGVALDATFSESEVVLSRLEASSAGRGRLSASGRLEGGSRGLLFGLDVESNVFPVGGPGGVSARITGAGKLSGSFTRKQGLVGELLVSRARILVPLNPPRELQTVSRLPDVIIATGPEAYLRERRSRRRERSKAIPVELRIRAPSRFFVVGDDVNAELVADGTVRRISSGELVASGEARARRGWVRVLGRTFILEEALARWTGASVLNPNLSISARYDARQATAWVDVDGPAAAPRISLRSEPPMPESQVALLIATGRTDLPGQAAIVGDSDTGAPRTNLTGAAASVAGSFAAAKLRQALGPRLPLDVFALETTGEHARLEAGTFVSERLYLGYLRNFLPDPGENLNEVRAAYELSRTVSLEAYAGDRAAAGVDLVWGKQIATPGQQRARRRALEERAAEREAREREGEGSGGDSLQR